MSRIAINTEIDKSILFDPSSLKIFINKNYERVNTEFHQADFKLPETEINDNPVLTFNQSRVIRRLSINISNTCNLACEYCYARKGNYGKENRILTTEEVLNYLFPLLKKYQIHSIMFFGGEPCLNIDTIIDCCIFINELYKSKKINNIMSFGIVTNLYVPKETLNKMILLSKQFNLNITVSIDGPKLIHDKNRILPNGEGTYDKIRDNYLYLKARGVHASIQCTYTKDHFKQGISSLELLMHFEKDFGVSNIHLAFESVARETQRFLSPNNYIKDLCELFSYCILKKYQGKKISISYLDRILSAIVNRSPIDLYCPALIRDVAVDIDGKLYPCFMFFDNSDFYFDDKRIDSNVLLYNIRKIAKKDIKQCKNCWNRNLCFGCIAGDYLETSSINEKTNCMLMKTLSIETILRVVELSMGIQYESLGTAYRNEMRSLELNFCSEIV